MLTYDAHPGVLDLYPECEIIEFEIPHTAHKQQVGTEYLVIPEGIPVPELHPLGKGDWWAVA